jgi:hypothetical protein
LISSIFVDKQDAGTVYVVSRDQTMSIVDMETKTPRRVWPLFEPIEAAVYIPTMRQLATVGEQGILKLWDPMKGKMMKEKKIIK